MWLDSLFSGKCPLVFPAAERCCVGNTVKTQCERWWEAGYRKRGNESCSMWHHRLQRPWLSTALWSRIDKQWGVVDLVLFGYNILCVTISGNNKWFHCIRMFLFFFFLNQWEAAGISPKTRYHHCSVTTWTIFELCSLMCTICTPSTLGMSSLLGSGSVQSSPHFVTGWREP